jgi:putative DNA primase/helicase
MTIRAASLFWEARQAGWTPGRERKVAHGGGGPAGPSAAAAPADEGVELTEHGVALAFVSQYRNRLRYCHDTGAWFQWNGAHWRRDRKSAAFSCCRELVAKANRDAEFKTQAITGKAAFVAGAERFARADPVLAVTADAWNPDPWLLGTPGGTVDLRTGALRPAMLEEMITRTTAVVPAAVADCPKWLVFLEQATGHDVDLIGFLQRWCGYCLTGLTREHALLFIYGPGGNGKSLFLNAVSGILGDYHATAAMDTFTDGGSRHLAFLAMLAGARMVTAAETEEGGAWAETKIKEMTGGTLVTANFMRQNPFSYLPQFKITISGNNKPVLRTVDDAARRRFNIVPFLHKPLHPDSTLEEQLRAEWPGILRWCIDGCLKWQQLGLQRPKVVLDATADYFEAQDAFGRWIGECCDLDPSGVHRERAGILLSSFTAWCARSGEPVTDNRRLRGQLERTPGVKYVTKNGYSYVKGIRLLTEEEARSRRAEADMDGASSA